MSLAASLGLSSGRKVRYALVGLGDITQAALLPGVAHTGNSEVTALVTGDPEKARAVGERYGVANRYGYGQFEALLRSGEIDAIYLATPNWRHAEFAIPALQAGVHVLCEKPLEVWAEACRAILEAIRSTPSAICSAKSRSRSPRRSPAAIRRRVWVILMTRSQ